MQTRIVAMALLLVGAVGVQAQTADEILARVQSKLNQIQTYKTHYVQTTTSKALPGLNGEERGILYRKGDTIRKEIQTPQPKIVLISPEGYYEKDMVTGAEKRMDPESMTDTGLGGTPLKSMSPEDILRQFSFKLEKEEKASFVLAAAHQGIMMRVWVDKASDHLSRFQVLMSDQPILTANLTYKPVNGIDLLSQIDADIRMKLGTQTLDVRQSTVYLFPELNPPLSDQLFDVR